MTVTGGRRSKSPTFRWSAVGGLKTKPERMCWFGGAANSNRGAGSRLPAGVFHVLIDGDAAKLSISGRRRRSLTPSMTASHTPCRSVGASRLTFCGSLMPPLERPSAPNAYYAL
jgi:hypothetical protein